MSFMELQVIQIPLLMLPAILAQVADVTVALERISKFLTAEEMDEPYSINDADDGVALDVDGDFEWESTPAASERLEVSGEHAKATAEKASESKAASKKPSEKSPPTAEESEKAPEEPPFALKDLKLRIKKGAFVGIVGGIGSGKVCFIHSTSFYHSKPEIELYTASAHRRDAPHTRPGILLRLCKSASFLI